MSREKRTQVSSRQILSMPDRMSMHDKYPWIFEKALSHFENTLGSLLKECPELSDEKMFLNFTNDALYGAYVREKRKMLMPKQQSAQEQDTEMDEEIKIIPKEEKILNSIVLYLKNWKPVNATNKASVLVDICKNQKIPETEWIGANGKKTMGAMSQAIAKLICNKGLNKKDAIKLLNDFDIGGTSDDEN